MKRQRAYRSIDAQSQLKVETISLGMGFNVAIQRRLRWYGCEENNETHQREGQGNQALQRNIRGYDTWFEVFPVHAR